jgi:photosynthesis system II assembly factor YCF48-like protein
MPSEDRGRMFEKALARHLRSEAAAAEESACLDAEVLAAYHERLLSSEEMSAAKDHLVSCARCQEILAQLEATQDVNVLQNREDDLVAAGAAFPVKSSEVVEEADAAATVPLPDKKATNVTEFRRQRNSRLRWAAPAGAIAAGLLLWIGLRDDRSPLSKKSQPAAQIAENRGDAARTPPFPAARPEPMTRQKSENLPREESRAGLKEYSGAPPSAGLHDEMQNFRKSAPPPAHANADKKAPSPTPLAVAPKGLRPKRQSDDRLSPAEAGKLSAKTEKSDVPSETAALDSAQVTGRDIQNLESEPQIVAGAAGGARTPAAPPAPSPQPALSRSKVAAQTQAGAAEVVGASRLNKDANQPALYNNAILSVAALPSVAATSDGRSIWRFGEHGAIAHSSDSGKTWESQYAALKVTLTSGSAPNGKICWIAGAGGALLRTTDGGKHWQLVTTPISADLGGVHATDAKHASIWDVPNRLSYETSDGGVTWKQTANE